MLSLLFCVLLLPPIALTTFIVVGLRFIRDWRKSWGSHRPMQPASILIVIGFISLHAGYYLAPFLYLSNRTTLALWLVSPIAFAVSLTLLWHLIFKSMSFSVDADEKFKRKAWVIALIAATYFLPVVVMTIGS